MANPNHSPTIRQRVIAMASGAGLGFLAYLFSLVALMTSVPRRPEGIREVVDAPWPLYVMLPTATAGAIWRAAMLGFPKNRLRSHFVAAFGAAIILGTYGAIDLLRRDYIGKF